MMKIEICDNDRQRASWVRLVNCARMIPTTVSEIERRDRSWPPGDLRLRYLGWDGGVPVAIGELAFSPYAPADHLNAIVAVEPSRRGNGLGSRMLATLEGAAAERGYAGLVATVDAASSEALVWAQSRGFEYVARRIDSLLDLTRFDSTAVGHLRAPTVEATATIDAMTRATEVAWSDVLALFRHLLADTPDMAGVPQWSLARCGSVLRDDLNARADWTFVAWEHDTPVGITVGRSMGDAIYSYFTGVIRERRRRGLAMALKLALIESARRRGVSAMRTTNLDRNAEVLRLNAALGFRPIAAAVEYRKTIQPGRRWPGHPRRQ
jgi:GNAT superfamily N-acetyltransferase